MRTKPICFSALSMNLLLLGLLPGCPREDTFEGKLDAAVPGPDLFIRSANPTFGSALVAEDVNGDGEVDYVVSEVGTTYVFLGPLTTDLTTADASAVLFGDTVSAGDLDEDGLPELFTISYPDPWNPVVHVYAWPYPDVPSGGGNRANVTLLNNSMGIPQVLVGDIHESPGLELIVGRAGYDGYGTDEGAKLQLFRASRVNGERSSLDAVEIIDATFGAKAFSRVDIADGTGDGVPDMLVSFFGFNHSNESYLLQGPLSGTGDLEDYTGVAFSVRYARILGDVNGDGLPDVGGPYFEGARVWMGPLTGPDAGPETTAIAEGLEAPGRVTLQPAGDFDGDGLGDVLVIDPIGPQTHVYFGPLSESARRVMLAPSDQEVVGFNVGIPVPDVDGDGFGELLLGAGSDLAGKDVGIVWLHGLP